MKTRSFNMLTSDEIKDMIESLEGMNNEDVREAKAWALYRLKKAMKKGVVAFAYEKADGTLRRAKGTLNALRNIAPKTGTLKTGSFPYFDAEANAFRSFRIENLVTVY